MFAAVTETILPGDTSGSVEQKGKPFADFAPAEREAFMTQYDVDVLKTPLKSVRATILDWPQFRAIAA